MTEITQPDLALLAFAIGPAAAAEPAADAARKYYAAGRLDYDSEGLLLLTDVAAGGPADKAGLKAGDVIVELAGRKIDNIYDYTYAIEAVKIGQKALGTASLAGQADGHVEFVL